MSKKEEILSAAEKRARVGGYAGFSFRELAEDVGVKSASIHYHFKTKEDLGVELARTYADRFFAPLTQSGKNAVAAYAARFTASYEEDEAMCLCGLLGAESSSLPEAIRAEVNSFFERSMEFLESAYIAHGERKPAAQKKAIAAFSMLEGALMLSISLGSARPLRKVVSLLREF